MLPIKFGLTRPSSLGEKGRLKVLTYDGGCLFYNSPQGSLAVRNLNALYTRLGYLFIEYSTLIQIVFWYESQRSYWTLFNYVFFSISAKATVLQHNVEAFCYITTSYLLAYTSILYYIR